MAADICFGLLLERSAAKAGQPPNLKVAVVDDDLVITPDRETGDVIVRGNEILVGERRLVFRLSGAAQTWGIPLISYALTTAEDKTVLNWLTKDYMMGAELRMFMNKIARTGQVVFVDDDVNWMTMVQVKLRKSKPGGGEV